VFASATLEADDLFLLESYQIAYLPGWVPERIRRGEDDIHTVLINTPRFYRFAEYDEADARKRKYWKEM
jgi:hypothetical protein